MESFFSIKNLKSRKKVTEALFSGCTSLSFYMMQKFTCNNIFSLSSYSICLIIITF